MRCLPTRFPARLDSSRGYPQGPDRNRPARHPTAGVRLHDLRHTFAVQQLWAGTHFMQVSKWLGHSTFTWTLGVYGDYIPDEDGGWSKRCLSRPRSSVGPPLAITSYRCGSRVGHIGSGRSTGARPTYLAPLYGISVAIFGARESLRMCNFNSVSSRCQRHTGSRP